MPFNTNSDEVLQRFGGKQNNCLNDLLFETSDEGMCLSSDSPYVTVEQMCNQVSVYNNHFSILSLNCQSINAKFDNISILIETLRKESGFFFGVICIQETWLSKHSVDADTFSIPNYKKPLDLPASCSKHGGLICYVHESLQAEIVKVSEKSQLFEGIVIEISGRGINPTLIANFYRPPRFNNNNRTIEEFTREISPMIKELSESSKNAILAADFNIDLLKVNEKERYAIFLDLMLEYGFFPKISLPTRFAKRSASLLDQIYVKNRCNNFSTVCSGILLSPTSDHFGCFSILETNLKTSNNPKYISVTEINETTVNNFSNEISKINFTELLDRNLFTDPNITYDLIEAKIKEAKDKHIPSKLVKYNKYKHKKSPWITFGILRSIKFRDNLYAKLKKAPPDSRNYESLKNNYNVYNKLLNELVKEAKIVFYDNELKKHSSDLKKTWSTINRIISRNRKSNEFPSYIMKNSSKITNAEEIVNTLNHYFSTVGASLASGIQQPEKQFSDYLKQRTLCSFSFKTVHKDDIIKMIDNFKPKTSTGPDGLSMKLLKTIRNPIAPALSLLVNQSLCTGIFPSKFKIAKVLPLLKKPNNYTIENFRPISLLNCISKVIEKCVFNQVYDYFECNKLFYTSQYGYRKEHSTELACIELVDKIYQQLESQQTPVCIFLDLSKAFDTLNHEILLRKLKHYGLSETPIKWFTDYLSNRHQFVEVDNVRSSVARIETGVPQGSILGPLLFIIYMNDISSASEIFQAVLYADDTSLNATISTRSIANQYLNTSRINAELNLISKWLACNKLSLNIGKTKFMIFRYPQHSRNTLPKLELSINDTSIEQVNNFDFLGLTISETLSWKPHVDKISMKITKVLAMMRKIKRLVNQSILLKIYNALILSRINYAILCWGYEHKRIFILQKKALRIIANVKYNSHTDPLYKRFNKLKVKDIFAVQSAKFYYKYSNDKLPRYFNNMFNYINEIHGYNTRGSQSVFVPISRRQNTLKSLRYSVPVTVNQFPNNIMRKMRTHSLDTIKTNIKKFIIDAYPSECNITNCYICGR